MKQLEDILKRIESLEARLAKLEETQATSGKSSSKNNRSLSLVEEYNVPSIRGYIMDASGKLEFNFQLSTTMIKSWLDERLNKYAHWRECINNGEYSESIRQYNRGYNNIYELSDGHLYYLTYKGDTLREVKAFASLIGYEIPPKPKTNILAASIVRDRGDNGWCFAEGQALKNNGAVYTYTKLTSQDLLSWIKKICQTPEYIVEEPDVKGKSEKELVETYITLVNSVKLRPLPSKEEILRQFDEALRIEKLKVTNVL